MDLSGWIGRTALCLLGCIVIGCNAGNKWQKTDQPDKSITCYQCNSEYDPRCADPFDNYTLGTVDCSMKRPLEHMLTSKPVLCRKTIQKVQGKTRVIRGCGYVRDERDNKECVRRTGTHDVFIWYCSCTTDLCNTAYKVERPSTLLAVLLAAFISIVRLA